MESTYTETISALGIYSALLSIEQKQLLELSKCEDADIARLFALKELYPKLLDKDYILELGAYYDPIRRCLENDSGSLRSDRYSLDSCILGERVLFSEPYFSAWYTPHNIVGKIAEGLGKVNSKNLRLLYDSILSVDPEAMIRTPYGPEPVFGDQDFEHTWNCYIQLQPFFERANKLGHDVVFALHGDV